MVRVTCGPARLADRVTDTVCGIDCEQGHGLGQTNSSQCSLVVCDWIVSGDGHDPVTDDKRRDLGTARA